MQLDISGIQYDISWENKEENITKIEKLLGDIPSSTDIILLPEMFTSGFSMSVDALAEKMNGNTVNWMKSTAKSLNKIVAGSIIIDDNNQYRNRFLWVEPDGNIQFYDKRHSFGLGDEDQYFTSGNIQKIIEYKDWKIFPLICYDLRFPEWIKNNMGYDLIINVANWPSVRAEHWKLFLKSRAVENQAYVFGLNRIGTDVKNRHYSGDSAIVNFNGELMSMAGEVETILTAKFSKSKLEKYRKSYPFLKDQDKFQLDL